jgi:hypothetical protein
MVVDASGKHSDGVAVVSEDRGDEEMSTQIERMNDELKAKRERERIEAVWRESQRKAKIKSREERVVKMMMGEKYPIPQSIHAMFMETITLGMFDGLDYKDLHDLFKDALYDIYTWAQDPEGSFNAFMREHIQMKKDLLELTDDMQIKKYIANTPSKVPSNESEIEDTEGDKANDKE